MESTGTFYYEQTNYKLIIIMAALIGLSILIQKIKFMVNYSNIMVTALFIGSISTAFALRFYSFDAMIIDDFHHKIKQAMSEFCLPIMLFNSGLSIKRFTFFQSFGALSLYGILGNLFQVLLTYLTIKLLNLFGLFDDYSNKAILLLSASVQCQDIFSKKEIVSRLDLEPLLQVLILGECIVGAMIPLIMIQAEFDGYQFLTHLLTSITIGIGPAVLCGQILQLKRVKSFCQFEMSIIIFLPIALFILFSALNIKSSAGMLFYSITFLKNVTPELSEEGKTFMHNYYKIITRAIGVGFFVFLGSKLVFLFMRYSPEYLNLLIFMNVTFIFRYIIITTVSKIVDEICHEEVIKYKDFQLMICSFPLGIVCYNQALYADNLPFNYNDRLVNFMTYYIVINVILNQIFWQNFLPKPQKFSTKRNEEEPQINKKEIFIKNLVSFVQTLFPQKQRLFKRQQRESLSQQLLERQ